MNKERFPSELVTLNKHKNDVVIIKLSFIESGNYKFYATVWIDQKTVHNLSKIHTSPRPQLFLPLIILFCYVLNHIASIPLWCTCSINMSWKFAVSVSILCLTYVIWNFSLYTNLAFLGKIAINCSYFMKSTLNPMTDTSDLHQLVTLTHFCLHMWFW